jgi:hypothetical protein
MRITSGGNVGIGTTSPDRPLDIYNASTIGIARIRANNTNGAALTIQNDENAQSLSIYAVGSAGFGVSGWAGNSLIESLTGIVYSAYNGNHIFQSGTSARTERMRIAADGNVGIGTTSPAYKLDIYSSSPATIGLKTDSLYNSVIRDYTNINDGYFDITTERTDGGGFNFLLLVSSTLVASGSHRNYYTFAVAGRGTTATSTQLSNVSAGTAARTAIAVSFPSNGVIRLTLTGAETCQIKVTAIGHGSL